MGALQLQEHAIAAEAELMMNLFCKGIALQCRRQAWRLLLICSAQLC